MSTLSLNSIIGNQRAITSIRIAIEAARHEGRLPRHMLLSGPGGLGKTTIAKLIAKEIGGGFVRVHGPSINRKNISDLITALISLKEGDTFFIDEVHALPSEGMEALYEAMEEGQVSIMVPDTNGEAHKPITIKLNPCLFLAATTQPNSLEEPFKMRFSREIILEDYTEGELTAIISNASQEKDFFLSTEECLAIAQRSRGRARKALQLMHVVMDHILTGDNREQNIKDAFIGLGVGEIGDTIEDRKYLNTLSDILNGGPAGINALISATGLSRHDIEGVIEPFLISRGLIKKTSKGRVLIHKLETPL